MVPISRAIWVSLDGVIELAVRARCGCGRPLPLAFIFLQSCANPITLGYYV
jgi:hypothetical protein